MSCTYPFGFAPIYRDGCCYLDGGIINDYPVNECIRDQKCALSEILGVKVIWEKKPTKLTEKSSLLQFIYTFFNQINSNFYENRHTKPIPNEVVCVSKVFSIKDWISWVKDENYRRELVIRGETFANVFLSYRRNFRDGSSSNELEESITSSEAHTSLTGLIEESEQSPVDRKPSSSPSSESIQYEIRTDDMTMM
jgi:hypothetical protein